MIKNDLLRLQELYAEAIFEVMISGKPHGPAHQDAENYLQGLIELSINKEEKHLSAEGENE